MNANPPRVLLVEGLAVLCTLIVVTVALRIFGFWILLLALAACGLWAYVTRTSWLPTVKGWIDHVRAWWKAKLGKPTVAFAADGAATWTTPAQDETHAGYRADYERLVAQPVHTRSDLYWLAELWHGLSGYGDRPLTTPVQVKAPRLFGGVAAVASPWGALLSAWPWILGSLGIGLLLAQWGSIRALTSARDAACSSSELAGHTHREACADLVTANETIADLNVSLQQLAHQRVEDIATAVQSTRATIDLNQRTAQRNATEHARQRRAHDDDVQSLRDSRAPDWDGRLRDLRDHPAPADGGSSAGGAASVDSTSGVSGPSAGAPIVPGADAAGAAAGSNGSAGGQGSNDGQPR